MYLVIMEDGQVFKTDYITTDEETASDDGYITIIDMSDSTIHFKGEWEEIEEFEH